MVPDLNIGSGSGSKLNYCQIDSPGCRYTRTVNLVSVQQISPNQSERGGLPAGRLADHSVDSYNAPVFAV